MEEERRHWHSASVVSSSKPFCKCFLYSKSDEYSRDDYGKRACHVGKCLLNDKQTLFARQIFRSIYYDRYGVLQLTFTITP